MTYPDYFSTADVPALLRDYPLGDVTSSRATPA